jgi:hypothetical protein
VRASRNQATIAKQAQYREREDERAEPQSQQRNSVASKRGKGTSSRAYRRPIGTLHLRRSGPWRDEVGHGCWIDFVAITA